MIHQIEMCGPSRKLVCRASPRRRCVGGRSGGHGVWLVNLVVAVRHLMSVVRMNPGGLPMSGLRRRFRHANVRAFVHCLLHSGLLTPARRRDFRLPPTRLPNVQAVNVIPSMKRGNEMSDQLPPSRFGAGYTYGGEGQAQPQPQPPRVEPTTYPTAPAYDSVYDPHGYGAAYAQPSSPPPAPLSPYPNPYAPTPQTAPYPGVGTANQGGGTAITAALLSFVGAAWHGLAAISSVTVLAGVVSSMSVLRSLGSALPSWVIPWLIGTTIAQILAPLLLLIGGIQLIRRSGGRGTITVGCLLVLVLKAIDLLVLYSASVWISSFTNYVGGQSSASDLAPALVQSGLVSVGLPALLAIITMILANAASTKRWCASTGPRP